MGSRALTRALRRSQTQTKLEQKTDITQRPATDANISIQSSPMTPLAWSMKIANMLSKTPIKAVQVDFSLFPPTSTAKTAPSTLYGPKRQNPVNATAATATGKGMCVPDVPKNTIVQRSSIMNKTSVAARCFSGSLSFSTPTSSTDTQPSRV
ncbi:unnamed protein product [Prorocentrum cordatum]|uniref:Uncharacterized protein n=1 Tax=Prorocentrum cordatum TaxID=2364126 RepID=A0ABN9WQ15_9DINO|nr:unnamed protein product [Polarella glacialis]